MESNMGGKSVAAPPPNYGPAPRCYNLMAELVHERTLQGYAQAGTRVIVAYDIGNKEFLVSVTRPNQDGVTFHESENTFPSNELVAKVMMVG